MESLLRKRLMVSNPDHVKVPENNFEDRIVMSKFFSYRLLIDVENMINNLRKINDK